MSIHLDDEMEMRSIPSRIETSKSARSSSPTASVKAELRDLRESMALQNADLRLSMAQQNEEFRAMFALLLERTKPSEISPLPLTSITSVTSKPLKSSPQLPSTLPNEKRADDRRSLDLERPILSGATTPAPLQDTEPSVATPPTPISDTQFLREIYETANPSVSEPKATRKSSRRQSTDMASHRYITDIQPLTTTQVRPPLTLNLDKITPYSVLEAMTAVTLYQDLHKIPVRIQEFMSSAVSKMLLATYASAGLTREIYFSPATDNSAVFKLLQRFCRPRDVASFCKILGEVRFRGEADIRDFFEDFPRYYQFLLLYITDFRQMYEFCVEHNEKNAPKCNFKPHGICRIFLDKLNPYDVENFYLRFGDQKFKFASEFLDTVTTYATQNSEDCTAAITLMNKYTAIKDSITPSFLPRRHTFTREATRVHKLRSVPEDRDSRGRDDDSDEDNRDSEYPDLARDYAKEKVSFAQQRNHVATYDQEPGDYENRIQERLQYAEGSPLVTMKACFNKVKTGTCEVKDCPWSHSERDCREEFERQMKKLSSSPYASGHSMHAPLPSPEPYRYNDDRPQSKPPYVPIPHADQARGDDPFPRANRERPKPILYGKRHNSKLLPETRVVHNVYEELVPEEDDFDEYIEHNEQVQRSLLHYFQEGNPEVNLSQAVHHPLTLIVPSPGNNPRSCTEIQLTKCLFDTGALHNSYIDKALVETMRETLEPCIHQFRVQQRVILADNKTTLSVNEYLLVKCAYMLNNMKHVVDLRLTILPMSNGNDIIIGLPEIANKFADLFIDMVRQLTTTTQRKAPPMAYLEPLHHLRHLTIEETLDHFHPVSPLAATIAIADVEITGCLLIADTAHPDDPDHLPPIAPPPEEPPEEPPEPAPIIVPIAAPANDPVGPPVMPPPDPHTHFGAIFPIVGTA